MLGMICDKFCRHWWEVFSIAMAFVTLGWSMSPASSYVDHCLPRFMQSQAVLLLINRMKTLQDYPHNPLYTGTETDKKPNHRVTYPRNSSQCSYTHINTVLIVFVFGEGNTVQWLSLFTACISYFQNCATRKYEKCNILLRDSECHWCSVACRWHSLGSDAAV